MYMEIIKDKALRQEITDAYFRYFEAYTKRQWERMLASFAPNITMFGTGIDEVCHRGEQTIGTLRREFSQSPSPIHYTLKSMEAYAISDRAALLMVTMDICFHNKLEEVECPNNRTSAIMVKEQDGWKLAHGHWSQPDRDIDVGESVPYRLLLERSRELEDKVRERTSQIEAQKEELRQLNQTKDKLFSIIAHDLRNPFNSILGFSEELRGNRGAYQDEQVQDMLDTIHRQAGRTYDMLENLLQWARSQTNTISFRPESFLLEPLLQEVTEHFWIMIREKRLRLRHELPDNLTVRADRRLLEIILRNLLHNAIKFSEREGELVVSARTGEKEVLLAVSDQGVGMPESQVRMLMNDVPGDHEEAGGGELISGLGLLLCREFIQRHGSRLHIQSKENQGSTFSFTLPA